MELELSVVVPRLPLPQMELSGHWTINHGGGDARKLLCPAEKHPAEIKVNRDRPSITPLFDLNL